jgi:predicted PurR-regulated permease PerM
MRAPEPDTEEQAPEPDEPPPEAVEKAPLPLKPPSAAPPANVEPVVVPRWIQLVMLPLLLLGAWALARAAGPVLLVFIIAGLIALLLNPFVTLLRRAHFPRGAAVATVYLVLLLAVVGLGVLFANPVANQVSAFRDEVPSIVDGVNDSLANVQDWLDRNGVDLQVSKPGQTAVDSLGDRIAEGSGELVAFTRDALLRLAETSIALILIVVLSIYMLLYGERIGAGVRAVVPPGDGSAEDDFPTRVQGAVFGYVRGQLLFSLIMGASAGISLYILGSLGIFPQGKTYAFAFGAFYGFAELIPYIGPAVGAFPPVMIALFSNEPLDALWLAIMFTGLQQIEGHIVAPNVFGHALRINPLLVIFALLLGGQIYGFIGAFIALPIAAIVRETVVYLRRHLTLEPWPRAPELALAGVGTESGACPECGATVAPGAERCGSCGTELGGAEATAAAASAGPS